MDTATGSFRAANDSHQHRRWQYGAEVARKISTGVVFVNLPTMVRADLPFGGIRHSGYGREQLGLGIVDINAELWLGTRPSASASRHEFNASVIRDWPVPTDVHHLEQRGAARGINLVVLLIWYTHRRASRRLGKLQNDLDALRQAFDLMSSRLLMTVLNRKPGRWHLGSGLAA
jgi:hypothetical protein